MSINNATYAASPYGTPGLNYGQQTTLGQLGGLGNNQVAGLLQSMVQLLQSVAPLLQALSSRLQSNLPALQLGNQLQGAAGYGNQFPGGNLTSFNFNPSAQFGNPTQFGSPAQFGNPAQFGTPVLGMPAQFGTPVLGTPAQFGTPVMGMPVQFGTPAPFSVNASAQFGNLTPQAALSWAQAYGGPNMQQSDIQQGMNLYSVFNTGSRMF
jgi:hypothetical protein